ncbi:hypothetical protein D3C80_728480 [compost metagenome]
MFVIAKKEKIDYFLKITVISIFNRLEVIGIIDLTYLRQGIFNSFYYKPIDE